MNPRPRIRGRCRTAGTAVINRFASRASLAPAKHAPTDFMRDVTPPTEPESRVLARMHSGPIAEASPPDRPILTALVYNAPPRRTLTVRCRLRSPCWMAGVPVRRHTGHHPYEDGVVECGFFEISSGREFGSHGRRAGHCLGTGLAVSCSGADADADAGVLISMARRRAEARSASAARAMAPGRRGCRMRHRVMARCVRPVRGCSCFTETPSSST
jgi:hypothetical protein